MEHSITYSDILKDLPTFKMVCQKRDNQIPQPMAENAAEIQWRAQPVHYPAFKVLMPPIASEATQAGTVTVFTVPVSMDRYTGWRTISDDEWAKRFVNRTCLHWGWFNHWPVACAVRENAWTFRYAGADNDEPEATKDATWQRKEWVIYGMVTPWWLEKVFVWKIHYNVLEFQSFWLARWR